MKHHYIIQTLIAFLCILLWSTTNFAQTSASCVQKIDYQDFCRTMAGICAQVGGIVVVFVAFAIQEIRNATGPYENLLEMYKKLHNKSKVSMLLFNAFLSMVAFLGVAVFLTFGLLTSILPWEVLAYFGMFCFSFGIFTIIIAFMAFMIFEKPFLIKPSEDYHIKNETVKGKSIARSASTSRRKNPGRAQNQTGLMSPRKSRGAGTQKGVLQKKNKIKDTNVTNDHPTEKSS